MPVTEVNDPTFSEEILGKGIAIRPTVHEVVSPCDGTVEMMFDTGHAVSLTSKEGAEILIHIGLETVKLKGAHYTTHAANGDQVKKGDPLMRLDLDYLKAHAPSLASPVLCTELEPSQRIRLLAEGEVHAGDPLFAVETLRTGQPSQTV